MNWAQGEIDEDELEREVKARDVAAEPGFVDPGDQDDDDESFEKVSAAEHHEVLQTQPDFEDEPASGHQDGDLEVDDQEEAQEVHLHQRDAEAEVSDGEQEVEVESQVTQHQHQLQHHQHHQHHQQHQHHQHHQHHEQQQEEEEEQDEIIVQERSSHSQLEPPGDDELHPEAQQQQQQEQQQVEAAAVHQSTVAYLQSAFPETHFFKEKPASNVEKFADRLDDASDDDGNDAEDDVNDNNVIGGVHVKVAAEPHQPDDVDDVGVEARDFVDETFSASHATTATKDEPSDLIPVNRDSKSSDFEEEEQPLREVLRREDSEASKDSLTDFDAAPTFYSTSLMSSAELGFKPVTKRKIFDPNETVEEGSSFEEDLIGKAPFEDSGIPAKESGISDYGLTGFEKRDPKECLTSNVSLKQFETKISSDDLFDAFPQLGAKMSDFGFDLEPEVDQDPFGITSGAMKPILPASVEPSGTDNPFLQTGKSQSPVQTTACPTLLDFEPAAAVSHPTEVAASKPGDILDLEEPLIGIQSSPALLSSQQPTAAVSPKSGSIDEDDKLSFLLEDAQRDDDDDDIEPDDDDDDVDLPGNSTLEDEGDPWAAPRRKPLDSAGESLSHPVSI